MISNALITVCMFYPCESYTRTCMYIIGSDWFLVWWIVFPYRFIEYNMTNQNACSVKALPNQVRKAGHDYSYNYKEFERLVRKCIVQWNVLQNRILKLNTLSNKGMDMLCFCNLYLLIYYILKIVNVNRILNFSSPSLNDDRTLFERD